MSVIHIVMIQNIIDHSAMIQTIIDKIMIPVPIGLIMNVTQIETDLISMTQIIQIKIQIRIITTITTMIEIDIQTRITSDIGLN